MLTTLIVIVFTVAIVLSIAVDLVKWAQQLPRPSEVRKPSS